MRVEQYSDKYFLDLVKIVQNFHKEAVSEYDKILEPQALVETIKTHAGAWTYLMIVDGVAQGVISGIVNKSMFNSGLIFQELIWYVNEPYRGQGVRLLKQVEKLLKYQGVTSMIMVVLENSKTHKLKELYTRMGYKSLETHFMRSL